MPTAKTNRAQQGDVYCVELAPGLYAAVKVAYVSTVFRNVIGVVVGETLMQSTNCSDVPPEFSEPVIYTAQACAQKEWTFILHLQPSAEDLTLTTRLVGGSVYCGDTELRAASKGDWKALPHMDVEGCVSIVGTLRSMFNLAPG